MKCFIQICSIFLFLPALSVSQTFVSTSPEDKNVVLEQFTGMYAGFDPNGHVIADNVKASNPNDVFLIRIHTGGYSYPNGPSDPDFNCLYGAYIAGNSGLAGYPSGTINRHNFEDIGISPQGSSGTTALSRGDWQQAATEILSHSSPVNVAAQASFDMSTGVLTVNTETYYTSTVTQPQFLHVAVLQNNIPGPQSGAQTYNPADIISGPWSPTYNHRDVLRHLMDGRDGLEFNVTSSGTFIPNTHTWAMPTTLAGGQSTNGYFPDLDPTNLEVIAFISEGDHEIYTGYETPVNFIFTNSYDINVITASAENVVCASETDIEVTFRNYGNQTLTSCDLTYDINGGTATTYHWTGNMAPGD